MISAAITLHRARRQGFRWATCWRLAKDARASALDTSAAAILSLTVGFLGANHAITSYQELKVQRDDAIHAKASAEAVIVSCLNKQGAIIDDEGFLCDFVSIGKHPR